MKIATWNVNSIRMRLPHVVAWLTAHSPDVLLLQEVKVPTEQFPTEVFEELGYYATVVGQKGFNGVAILSRRPLEVEHLMLPGETSDGQARYVEGVIGNVRVASLYVPNGNPIASEKFSYKLSWMDRLLSHVRSRLELEEATVLGGDFNVCPVDSDVYDPQAFAEDALCHPASRARFRALCHLGLTDAVRVFHPEPGVYTFWDYQGGRWHKDEGLRIDHLLLSPQAADRLIASGVDKGPRDQAKPSDHAPVWCELADLPPRPLLTEWGHDVSTGL
ncbi:MAG: exodeoxyribonuclease III [Nitrospirae bacterium]|nr:MAG: exodeoxyribonuclease III [Nitrospirota bacterium]